MSVMLTCACRSLGDLDFKEPARFVECEPEVRAPSTGLTAVHSATLLEPTFRNFAEAKIHANR